MKRNYFAVLLVLYITFLVFPVSTAAATPPTEADLKTAPLISNLEIHDDAEGFVWLEVTVQTPANVLNAIDYFENHELGYNQAGYIGQIDLQYAIDGAEWSEAAMSALGIAGRYYGDADEAPVWNGIHETHSLSELHVDSQVRVRARYSGADADGNPRYSNWSNVLTLNETVDFTASQWALSILAQADSLGLIPDSLKDADLTKPITRAEFAAVSVRVYEALSGEKANPASVNPFTDTKDVEVLKAYQADIAAGTSATTFHPDNLLNREQAATMLTKVYKKISIDGWESSKDSAFSDTFNAMFTMPEPFADDAKISDWAKPSVYFMAAKGIISGVGNHTFAPKATTEAEAAIGYAQATREQAFVIATKMVQNLK